MKEQKLTDFEVFNNEEFGEVRGVIIDGEPYFVAKDVSDSLGYTNSREALRKHVDPDYILVSRFVTRAGEREFSVISEAGLYSLILRSKKPVAKKFAKWVTSEVLPSIRKHGMYITEEKLNLEKEELLKEVEEYRDQANSNYNKCKATFDYMKNSIRASKLSDSVLGRISAEYGLSVKRIFNILNQRFVVDFIEDFDPVDLDESLFPKGVEWVLSEPYRDQDYTVDVRYDNKDRLGNKTGGTHIHREFTNKAYDIIIEAVKECGHKPVLVIEPEYVLREDSVNILAIDPRDFVVLIMRDTK